MGLLQSQEYQDTLRENMVTLDILQELGMSSIWYGTRYTQIE